MKATKVIQPLIGISNIIAFIPGCIAVFHLFKIFYNMAHKVPNPYVFSMFGTKILIAFLAIGIFITCLKALNNHILAKENVKGTSAKEISAIGTIIGLAISSTIPAVHLGAAVNYLMNPESQGAIEFMSVMNGIALYGAIVFIGLGLLARIGSCLAMCSSNFREKFSHANQEHDGSNLTQNGCDKNPYNRIDTNNLNGCVPNI
jgi:hypothetical protein